MSRLNLLFASSEVYPFAKSGGLADVSHSLPRSLSSDYDASVVMPLYQFVKRSKFGIIALDKVFDIIMGGVKYRVELFGCKFEGVNYFFLYSPLLCDREFLYGPPNSGYDDNAIRFGIFNYAIVELLKYKKYDIVHLNDWQSALVPLLLKDAKTIKTRTLYTIHNLAYQGVFDKSALKELGIDEKYFTMDGIEFYNKLSFMKSGISFADMITTVSPTYAKEILTPKYGCGLEGFLHYHRKKLVGIVNGIDIEHFSPLTDFSAKALNKKTYLKQVGLKDIKKPLFIFIGRFTSQKGISLLIAALEKISLLECNIAILGEGEEKYHKELKKIVDKHSNAHLESGYDEALSHQMYAAADFLLMPSLFEPCGLNQMIAMHNGTMPIVHGVGGLVDTVHCQLGFDATKNNNGYGIIFKDSKKSSFIKAINLALELYANKRQYNKIIKHNIGCDFSWRESAKLYKTLYAKIVL